MSAPNPVLAPTTSDATIQLQTQEADQVLVYVTTTLGSEEIVEVLLPTTTGALRQYINPLTGVAVTLGPSTDSALLPGGVLYTLRKSSTIAPTGIDVQFKPRIGPH